MCLSLGVRIEKSVTVFEVSGEVPGIYNCDSCDNYSANFINSRSYMKRDDAMISNKFICKGMCAGNLIY